MVVPPLKDVRVEWKQEEYAQALAELTPNHPNQDRSEEAVPGVMSKYGLRRLVYFPAIVVWTAIWIVLGVSELGTNPSLGLFGSRGQWVIFLFPPHAVVGVALLSNLVLWKKGSAYSSSESELKIIDVLERHASFFLIGSSAVFVFASLSIRDLGLKFSVSAFIIYETLSLICLSTVLLLYWIPAESKPENLVLLRHLKTIPFTFAVSFFLAALMTITTAVLPQRVP